jgi:hypothetical protein
MRESPQELKPAYKHCPVRNILPLVEVREIDVGLRVVGWHIDGSLETLLCRTILGIGQLGEAQVFVGLRIACARSIACLSSFSAVTYCLCPVRIVCSVRLLSIGSLMLSATQYGEARQQAEAVLSADSKNVRLPSRFRVQSNLIRRIWMRGGVSAF